MTTPSPPLTRDELRPYVGLPVHVEARLVRVGAKPLRGDVMQHTLLIGDLAVTGGMRIDHAWLKFGPTGSARIQKLRPKLTEGTPVRLDAKVAMYVTEGVPRLGLTGPHNAEVRLRGRWRLLVRGIEKYVTDDWEDELLDDALYEDEREAQRPVLEALLACPGRDRAAQQMLDAYFIRGELVSERQLAHARRLLCSS
ncbi:hypothetical protein [Deinococcus sp. S9]|uniref:hypothetical protein n=1 Tax=Deinococcus sp. S9 TaxID=2545754 RepID=UPI001056CC64|nr:hypothetical protein [Deinococcus sp. S9]TDE87383.1 hypothetical protein E0686_02500 [Deinococcus sp. S9]